MCVTVQQSREVLWVLILSDKINCSQILLKFTKVKNIVNEILIFLCGFNKYG